MDLVEATQVLRDEPATSKCEDEAQVGTLKIGSNVHAIRRGFNRIGRSPLCRVILNDATVSKVHAEIQVGAEAAFVSDLRSSNGTKIKDVPLKPFFYYSVNDGDVIYFGQVRAVYTTVRSTEPDDVLVPNTPVASKNRNGRDESSPGIGNISESFLSSSVCKSDISITPGSQETERKQQTFQRPSTPAGRKRCPSSSTKTAEAVDAPRSCDLHDLHEIETGNDVDASFQPPGAKRPRRNGSNGETNIHEAETRSVPSSIAKRKEPDRSQSEDDIFEGKSQAIPVSIDEREEPGQSKIQGSIFDAETQAMEFSRPKPEEPRHSRNSIHDAETRTKSATIDDESNAEKLEITKNIYDAETQMMQVAAAESEGPKRNDDQDNIHELNTQIFRVPTKDKEKGSTAACGSVPPNETVRAVCRTVRSTEPDVVLVPDTPVASKNRNGTDESSPGMNETGELSSRSNSSRDRLRLSSTPPSSPECDDEDFHCVQESQNLLEVAETPLLAYVKYDDKNSSREPRVADEEEPSVVAKDSRVLRRIQTIPESSDSETDDDIVSPRYVRRSKASNVIEDSSEDPTDEENEFGGNPTSRGKKEEASPNDIQGRAAAKRQEEVIFPRGSPTGLSRRNDGEASSKRIEEASAKGQADSNVLGDSPTSLSPKRNVVSPKTLEETTFGGLALTSKFGRSPLHLSRKRDVDLPTKIRGEEPEKVPAKSGILGRTSLRLSRKKDDASPKKIDEEAAGGQGRSKKSAKEREEDNVFEAATQRVVPGARALSDDDRREESNIDIALLPTQVLDVPISTPVSCRSKCRKDRSSLQRFHGEDLHCAPTQILKASPRRENFGSAAVDEKGDDEDKVKDGQKKIDLDDSLAINLGNLLGEEANIDDRLDDETTQLMTQNLVDILRPTQSFGESVTRNGKSSPRVADNNVVRRTSSPTRKRTYAPGTLGFVDGEARASGGELVSADSSPMKAAREKSPTGARAAEADEPETSEYLDEDDIFFGLPEVMIYGTLSNPGSPATSPTSSDNAVTHSVQSSSRPSEPARKSSSSSNPGSTSNRSESPDRDSPITPKKTRVTRRDASRYRIIDDAPEDSEDEFDYQDLKRMADRLLASGSWSDAKSRRRKNVDVQEKFDEPSVPPRQPNVRKTVAAKKRVASANRRAVELSCPPSSLTVSDVGGETSVDEASSVGTAETSGRSRKSSRRRKPTRSAVTSSTAVAKQAGEESQEIEEILGCTATDENRPMISRKSYAKIEMMRNDEGKRNDEGGKLLGVAKVTRKRRTMAAVKKDTPSPVDKPARSRGRRTIADAPGIPGTDGEARNILFTGVREDSYYKIVEKLGGTVVSDPSKATVLVTDEVRRTFKFLCAVARGIRVVSINWLLESSKASRFLDWDSFILNDPAAEARYSFSLEKSLRLARTKRLMDGYTIIVTPKVNQPEVHELKGMVQACGGRLLVRPDRNWNAKTVIISREEDIAVAKAYLFKAPKNLKITVQSTEFILTGILRQKISLVDHKLNFA